MLEKTLESPLDSKEIKPVHPKGTQSWIFIKKTDTEAETPILWPTDVKSWFIGKDSDAGKDWGHEEKGMTEDDMVGWHHQLSGISLSKLREMMKDGEAWHSAVYGVAKSWTHLSKWTTTDPSFHSHNWPYFTWKINIQRENKKTTQGVWSGHSRWWFSCSLYLPCSTRPCFTCTFSGPPACACPLPRLVLVLILSPERLHLLVY